MKAVAVTALVTAVLSALPGGQTAPAWPAPRGAHGMAFDAQAGLTLVYGDRGPEAGVLWGWDGRTWQRFEGEGPGLRRHIKLAYDTARRRTVLFGGLDDSGNRNYGDTWEWDGARWHRVATEGPEPRGSYALVYDSARARTVLFGGLSGTNGPLGDTWEWDGATWRQVSTTGPSPRGESGAVFDASSGRIVIAGGTTWQGRDVNGRRAWSARPRAEWPRDTWAWDGRSWQRLAEQGPIRFGPLVADPVTGAWLRVAGDSDNGLQGNMLRWTGTLWEPLPFSEIPSRSFHDAALDTRRQRVVVFGGSRGRAAVADVWEWDGKTWHLHQGQVHTF